MTDEQLAAIRARCEAATPGPWNWGRDDVPNRPDIYHLTATWITECENYPDVTVAVPDLDFIARARQDVPALLAEVERLRGLLSSGAAA